MIAARTADRSAASSSSVEETKTRSRRSGVVMSRRRRPAADPHRPRALLPSSASLGTPRGARKGDDSRERRWFDRAARQPRTGARAHGRNPVNAAPPTLDAPSGTRPLLPAMRILLGAFAVLTALGPSPRSSCWPRPPSETFAWTIQPPLTAAFLGAGYAAGFVLVVLSLRDPVWADIRRAGPDDLRLRRPHARRHAGAHEPLHFDDDFSALGAWRRGPPGSGSRSTSSCRVAMPVLLVVQERTPGRRPAARHPVPGVLRVALGRRVGGPARGRRAAVRRPDDGDHALAVGADALHARVTRPGCSPSGWRRRWPRSPVTSTGCARRRSPTRSSASGADLGAAVPRTP